MVLNVIFRICSDIPLFTRLLTLFINHKDLKYYAKAQDSLKVYRAVEAFN